MVSTLIAGASYTVLAKLLLITTEKMINVASYM